MVAKAQFTNGQIISMVAVFLLGTTILISPGQNLGKYAYLSILLAFGLFLLMLGFYYLLANLEPKKSIFALNEMAFGKILGTLINIFYLIYFFVLTVLVVANFVNFINTTILIRTPDMVTSSLLVAVVAYSVRAGLKPLAELSVLVLILTAVTVVSVTLMITEIFNLAHFLPLIPSDWNAILDNTFTVFAFPFGELIIFLGFLGVLGKPDKVFKNISKGSFLALIMMLLVVFRNTLVLGDFLPMTTYPSFETARLINIAQVITRAEVFIALNFIFNGFIKASITFYSLCRGLKETFRLKSYKHLVLPIGALVALNAHLSFPTIIQNIYFNVEFYRYYAIIPQVILVLLTYLVLLFKKRSAAK